MGAVDGHPRVLSGTGSIGLKLRTSPKCDALSSHVGGIGAQSIDLLLLTSCFCLPSAAWIMYLPLTFCGVHTRKEVVTSAKNISVRAVSECIVAVIQPPSVHGMALLQLLSLKNCSVGSFGVGTGATVVLGATVVVAAGAGGALQTASHVLSTL
jgi:hypothetical protein